MTTYDFIESNNRKTVILCTLFPLLVALLLTGGSWVLRYFYLHESNPDPYVLDLWWPYTFKVVLAVVAANLVWTFVSYKSSKDYAIKRLKNLTPAGLDNYPVLYRLVENISITAGIKIPQVYVMDTPAMNAFAAGTNPDDSAVVFTQGLLDTLKKSELEGVVAHEISHIVNRDTRLMMVLIFSASMFAILADIFFRAAGRGRMGRGKDRGKVMLILLVAGIISLLIYFVVAPLLRLAVSRRREFLADSSAALLTRNPEALAEALLVINGNSEVSDLNDFVHAQLCIEKTGKSFLSSLLSTHPSIEDRVEALYEMAN